jgi:hypothetical protein
MKIAGPSAVSITLDKAVLSAHFRNAPLGEVSGILAEKTRINIVLADGLADNLVSLDVSSTVIDVAIRAVFAGMTRFSSTMAPRIHLPHYVQCGYSPKAVPRIYVPSVLRIGRARKKSRPTLNANDPAVRQASTRHCLNALTGRAGDL